MYIYAVLGCFIFNIIDNKKRIYWYGNAKMCAWWDENTYLIMWKHIFGYVDMRVWWYECTYLVMQGYGHDESVPYTWRSVRNQFRGVRGELSGCSHSISWVLRKHSPNVRNVFAICLIYIRKMFATRWLSVCYILTEQKGGFCIAKVWFLACKKGVFDGQK